MRRSFYLTLILFVTSVLIVMPSFAQGNITAARLWPAKEYTRLAIESDAPFKFKQMSLKNPERLVLDIEDIQLNTVLKSLTDKVAADYPYISQVRTAQYLPNVVRIVIDLKAEVKSNVFTLPPVGDYKYRLVLDIYPLQDPLMAMLNQRQTGNTGEDGLPRPLVEPLPPVSTGEENTGAVSVNPEPQAASGMPAPATTESQPLEDKPVIDQPLVDKPLVDKPLVDKPLVEKSGKRMITIAIDPGHGGEDPGARGATGLREKDVTLAIAKKLKAKIDAEPNMRAVLTRDGDYFIPLHGRVVKARKLRSDLFISIHADAFTNKSARGSSVFALSERGATSATARYLAKQENESDLIGGVSLDDKDPILAKTLLDLSQSATISDSLKLGKVVLQQVGKINRLHKGSVEQAAFAVLKSPDIPSILVETAFISNPEEERKLNNAEHQEDLADSILVGIKKYFASNPALAKSASIDADGAKK